MIRGFALPTSAARSPAGTLAAPTARGRRLNVRDNTGLAPTAPEMTKLMCWLFRGCEVRSVLLLRTQLKPTRPSAASPRIGDARCRLRLKRFWRQMWAFRQIAKGEAVAADLPTYDHDGVLFKMRR